jgi:hypothetical protein
MSFNLGANLMLGHAWSQTKAPPTIDLNNKVVQQALYIYVWRACGGICFSDLTIDRAEIKPEGIYAYPETKDIAEGAALPTYVFAAFPPGFYRALECQSEGRCPRCEKHAITTTSVCTACAYEMPPGEMPENGTLYVKPGQTWD